MASTDRTIFASLRCSFQDHDIDEADHDHDANKMTNVPERGILEDDDCRDNSRASQGLMEFAHPFRRRSSTQQPYASEGLSSSMQCETRRSSMREQMNRRLQYGHALGQSNNREIIIPSEAQREY